MLDLSPTNKEQVGDIKVNGTHSNSHDEDEVEDPERNEQDTSQNYNSGLQESRFWLVKGLAWQNAMIDCPKGQRAQEGWLTLKKTTSSKHKNNPLRHAGSRASMAEGRHR